MEEIIHHVRNPYIPGKKTFRQTANPESIESYLKNMMSTCVQWYNSIFGEYPKCMKCTRFVCCNYCWWVKKMYTN